MTNEYGDALDRNGYASSIMQWGTSCYLCGSSSGKRDRHEPWGGANREKSKRYGMWCYLCHQKCHLDGAHKDPEINRGLRKQTQEAAMMVYGWSKEEFINRFGKSEV